MCAESGKAITEGEASRQGVAIHLHVQGIQTSHHYTPVHTFDYYLNHVPTAYVSLPVTETYAELEVTIPLHPKMSFEDVDWIVEIIKEGLAH